MAPAQGSVRLSVTGGPPRSPVYQHIAVGGNAYIPRILEAFGDELGATASSAQFRDKQALVMEQLQKRTASLSLKEASFDGGILTVDVALSPMTGHKFPTSFPSRRAWLHIVVQDSNGGTLFESGRPEPNGAIIGNDNDADPAAYEPHYQSIDSPDQVQIYEAIMGDTEGQVTTTLLRAAQYLKDNRLLPAGFDKDSVHEDIAVYGTAVEDPSFAGGGDVVRYAVDVGNAQGPFTITASLLYQPIGFRWADNLRVHEAPEPARFIEYYEQIANQPVVVATTTSQVDG